MKIGDKFINELSNKEYRDAFVSSHIDNGIPFQIKTLRKQRGWTQKELAERIGMKQERISALENPNYSKFTITPLKKIASAFDVALVVRFAPISELVKWELTLSPETLGVVSFEQDPYFKETQQENNIAYSQPEPSITRIVGQGGLVLGGRGMLSFSSPGVRERGRLYDFNAAKQKAAENKIDSDQKELDMPLLASLSGVTQ